MSERIAGRAEVLALLTDVLRGEVDGVKPAERMKAGELLAKFAAEDGAEDREREAAARQVKEVLDAIEERYALGRGEADGPAPG